MGFLALISVLNARKFVVAAAVAVSCVIALLAGIITPTEYKSTARVQVDSRQKNPLTGLFEPRLRVSEFLGQQAAGRRQSQCGASGLRYAHRRRVFHHV